MPGQLMLEGLHELRHKWGWFLALGIALLVLGAIALGSPWIATLASVMVFGWLILLGGVFEVVTSFGTGRWSGFLAHLLCGVLSIVFGVLIVGHPANWAMGLTMLLAALFLVGGVFRIIAAVTHRYPSWGWSALHGVINVVLGGLIWAELPDSTLWVIGTFIGIDLVFRGFAWIMFAFAIRELKTVPTTAGAPDNLVAAK